MSRIEASRRFLGCYAIPRHAHRVPARPKSKPRAKRLPLNVGEDGSTPRRKWLRRLQPVASNAFSRKDELQPVPILVGKITRSGTAQELVPPVCVMTSSDLRHVNPTRPRWKPRDPTARVSASATESGLGRSTAS